MKFIWHGDHDGEKAAIFCGVLDSHQRPLVNPSVVPVESVPKDSDSHFVIEAGKAYVIDHENFERGLNWVADWMASHPNFQVLDRDALPPGKRKG